MEGFDLAGKVAFVSGASRGLGERFALTLARAGCDVAVTSRDLSALEGIRGEIEGLGRRCLPLALDVREESSIRAAAAAADEHFGRVDILVNNAGCNVRKPSTEVTWEDWDLVVGTNLKGAFFLAAAVAERSMLPRGYGRVINIGSVTSINGYAGIAPYCASRGGMKQLTMSLADEWGEHGITVNCLAPGWFKTAQNAVLYEDEAWVASLCERIPVRRPGNVGGGDLDGALIFLASDAGAYVTGQLLLVDGGISVGSVRAVPPRPETDG